MMSLVNILSKYHVMLLNAAKITLIVSIITIILGLIFGTLMAFMKMSKIPPLRWFANVYVEFIRGTPVLVQISIVFYFEDNKSKQMYHIRNLTEYYFLLLHLFVENEYRLCRCQLCGRYFVPKTKKENPVLRQSSE